MTPKEIKPKRILKPIVVPDRIHEKTFTLEEIMVKTIRKECLICDKKAFSTARFNAHIIPLCKEHRIQFWREC